MYLHNNREIYSISMALLEFHTFRVIERFIFSHFLDNLAVVDHADLTNEAY